MAPAEASIGLTDWREQVGSAGVAADSLEVHQLAVISRTRVRLWWERAFWVIPAVGVVSGVLLSEFVSDVDDELSTSLQLPSLIAASSATQLLAAIGGGMITFTGFVFSFVVLLLQFGSSQYSPRTVSYFLRARATRVILAIFLGTVTFTFMSLLDVGSLGRPDYTPSVTVFLAVLLLFVSLAAFIWLLHSVGSRMRVDAVLSDLGRRARRQLAVLVGPRAASVSTVADEAPSEALTVRSAVSGQVIAVDQIGLVRVAARRGLRIWVVRQVGDAITPGAPLLRVMPPRGVEVSSALQIRLRRAVVIDSERSLRYDPFYALRLLVDIAIKALSPAINDPTTAVRALDEVEGVLRVAADLRLGPRRAVRGEGQVVVPAPSWADVVALGLLEIMVFGAGQPQITRRVAALIDDVIADTGEEMHPPLEQMRAELASLLAAESFDPELRRIAVVPDRQGLGGRLGMSPGWSAPTAADSA